MSVNSGVSKLNLGLKTLLLRWEETQGRWNDPVSRAFEEGHLQPLQAQVAATLRAIDQLAVTLTQARQECG